MNKEELIAENARLQNELANIEARDKEKRVQFAIAFNWRKKQSPYSTEDEYANPDWEQIFVHIGKLLANQKALQYVEDVESLRLDVQSINQDLHILKQDN